MTVMAEIVTSFAYTKNLIYVMPAVIEGQNQEVPQRLCDLGTLLIIACFITLYKV